MGKLLVCGEPPRGALLVEERGEEHLGDVALSLARSAHARHERRQKRRKRTPLTIAHGTPQEVRLKGSQQRNEVVTRDVLAVIRVEQFHDERRHARHLEPPHVTQDTGQLLVALHLAARGRGKVTGKAPQTQRKDLHAVLRGVAVKEHVTLERGVHLGRLKGLGRTHDAKIAARKLVKGVVVGIGYRAQDLLQRAPVRAVKLLLLAERVAHEHKVAHEVARGKVLARGIHGLKDDLRIVDALSERDRHDLEALQPRPHGVNVVERLEPLLKEGQVAPQARVRIRVKDLLGLAHLVRALHVVHERLVVGAVVFGERELVVVLARAVPVGEVAALHDLVARKGEPLLGMARRIAGKGHEQEHDGGDALLAVDDQVLRHALVRDRAVLNGDDRPRKVRHAAASAREDVIPQLHALFVAPGIGPLVNGHHVACVHLAYEPHDPAGTCIHL